jgi:cytochrome P450
MTMTGPRCDLSLAQLDRDPHPLLARARERSPACWVPELGGWLVAGYAAAVAVLTDPATFTVDDPRFTTARVTGPSMLSRDGAEHARHRAPFAHAFRRAELTTRLGEFTAAEAERLAEAIAPDGEAELRETVAGPLADAGRPNVGRHLAFARGPHFCIGAELARLEAVTAVNTLLARLPGLRLDGSRPAQVTGLVFRKPRTLHATWQRGRRQSG